MGRRAISLAALVGTAVVAVLAANACVGDSTTVTDSGVDSSTDATQGLDAANDTNVDAGGDACGKQCNGNCVSVDDPAYGCTPTSCSPCGALPHVATAKCSAGACAVGSCTPEYDDLDNDAGNGCETPNPLAFAPSSLALWLKGDKGLAKGGDGGVTSWANLATADAGVEPVGTGSPTVDTTLWPALPGASSVSFQGADSFAVDISSMMSSGGFTTFIALARYGDAASCVLGSHAYPSGGCCAQAGQDFEICYFSNTLVGSEVACNSINTAAVANTSSGYQSSLMTMWFDPAGPLNYFSLNGAVVNDTAQCPHALYNLSQPGFLGGGAADNAPYHGLIGEVVVYSTLLSVPDRAAVQAYLKTKWKTP